MRAAEQVYADIRAGTGGRRAEQPVARRAHAPPAAGELSRATRARAALWDADRFDAFVFKNPVVAHEKPLREVFFRRHNGKCRRVLPVLECVD